MASKPTSKGKVQISMWVDEDLAKKIEEFAESMNNTVSGAAGYFVRLGFQIHNGQDQAGKSA